MPPRTRKAITKPSQSEGEPTLKEIEAAIEVLETPDEVLDELEIVDDEGHVVPKELQFSTADLPDAPEPDDDESDIEYLTVDGFELTARKPEPAAWNVIIGSLSADSTSADRARALQTFVNHVFDEQSRMYINRRLFARGDKFDQDFLERIIVTIIERFTPNLNRSERRKAARNRR